jgi:hypothetical protein
LFSVLPVGPEALQKYGSLDRFYLETEFRRATFRKSCLENEVHRLAPWPSSPGF